MKISRIGAAAAATALALGLSGAAIGVAAVPASAHTGPAHAVSAHTVSAHTVPADAGSAHAASARTVWLINQCHGIGQWEPSVIPLPGCDTSQELIAHARWTSWKSDAFGSAFFKVNNCTPSSSCGQGQFTKYPVLLVLWNVKHRPGNYYFSRMTVIFAGKRPSNTPVTQTFTFLPHPK